MSDAVCPKCACYNCVCRALKMADAEKAALAWVQNKFGSIATKFYGQSDFEYNPCIEAFLAGIAWARANPEPIERPAKIKSSEEEQT